MVGVLFSVKNQFYFFLACFFALVPAIATADTWTTWTKEVGNPVYSHSGSGAWDVASDPTVIKDGSTYRMVVSGDGGDYGQNVDGNSLIMATSSDGVAWTTLANGANGVIIPSSTSLWDESLELPEFIKVGSEYLVFYSGYDPIEMENSGGLIFGDVGLATSNDGASFTRNGSPVLTRTPSSHDQDGITDVTIVESGGVLYMIYLGWCTQSCALNGGNPAFYTMKATSSDNGRTWTKQGLLSPQPSGIHTDLVLDAEGEYALFYGEDDACSGGTKVGLMQAQGDNPFGPFTPIAENPILCLGTQAFEGDGTDGGFPSVLNDGGVGRLYYTGINLDTFVYKIGLAVAQSDVTAPTLSSVSSDKADGSYKAGEVIDVDVTFFEAVTSTGNVTVILETGSTDRTCTFSVSNATSGTCNYTVQAGDTSGDLTVSSISGTISDQAGNVMSNFVPATNLAASKNLVIDTIAPTNQDVVFALDTTTAGGSSVTVVSSGVSANAIWFAPLGTATFSVGSTMTTAGGTATSILAPSIAGSYRLFILDLAGNISSGSLAILTVDGAVPTRSSGSPSGLLAAGTTSAVLSLDTDESATCRYGTEPDAPYGSLGNTFLTTGGMTHSATPSTLVNGTSYAYYIRCQDASGNSNADDYVITFSVASALANSPPSSSGSSKKKEKKSSRKIEVSSIMVSRGQVLVQSGKRFSKSSPVLLYFSKPGGGYYPPQRIITSRTGTFSVSYQVNKPRGTYSWYAYDVKKGKSSKVKTYTVR